MVYGAVVLAVGSGSTNNVKQCNKSTPQRVHISSAVHFTYVVSCGIVYIHCCMKESNGQGGIGGSVAESGLNVLEISTHGSYQQYRPLLVCSRGEKSCVSWQALCICCKLLWASMYRSGDSHVWVVLSFLTKEVSIIGDRVSERYLQHHNV